MGKADTATMAYMGQNDVFADAFNFFLYQGERVIRPEQLRELDPTELMLPYGTEQQGEPVQRYRDMLKGMTAMEDRLLPVITLFVSFSPEEWDGPRSLWEMMEIGDKKLRSRLPDYRINLVSPTEIGKEEFGQFHSSLGDVLEFIKYSGDKEKLMEWLHEEKPKLRLGRKEIEVLNACVNAKLAIKEEEEKVEVCKAIEDYKMEAVEKATKEVTKEATESTRLCDLKNLMKNMQWTANQAASALGLSPEDTAKFLAKL